MQPDDESPPLTRVGEVVEDDAVEARGIGGCASCGAPLEAEDRFCSSCGAALNQPTTRAPARTTPASRPPAQAAGKSPMQPPASAAALIGAELAAGPNPGISEPAAPPHKHSMSLIERDRLRREGPSWAPPSTSPQSSAPAYGPPPSGTNGYAIASLVLGIVWLAGLGSLLALIFGIMGKNQIDASGGRQTGRGMAVAGIVLGVVGLAGLIVWIILIASVASSTPTYS